MPLLEEFEQKAVVKTREFLVLGDINIDITLTTRRGIASASKDSSITTIDRKRFTAGEFGVVCKRVQGCTATDLHCNGIKVRNEVAIGIRIQVLLVHVACT